MNVLYAVSAQSNPLYQGKFGLHGRYQTYGQHSFIYDLIAAAYRRGVRVTLLVEGLSAFPLAEPLKKYAHVLELDEAPQLGTVDVPGKIQSENHRDPKRQSRRRVNTRWPSFPNSTVRTRMKYVLTRATSRSTQGQSRRVEVPGVHIPARRTNLR